MEYSRKLGLLGEMEAANYLRDRGYVIVQANYRCKAGEIDLICYKDGVMIFVEVKTRCDGAYFSPMEAVDTKKEENVKSSAANFMARLKAKCEIRFDIVEVYSKEGKFSCNHIKNAF